MTIRADALAQVEAYFDSGRFLEELADLIAVPSESQDPRGTPHLRGYLEEQMVPRLAALGFSCDILPNPEPTAGPFLVAERHEGADLPTVLTYGHGDVVRGQEGRWRKNRDPFTLDQDGDLIYGRGTADNKGQHLINLRALEAVVHSRGKLGFNIKLLLETGEEIGSPGLRQFCRDMKDRLRADVLIASDGPRLSPTVPTIFTGSRGAVGFHLEVNLREGANHSGNFGGLLADPAIILAHAIATITDARGQIQIPDWRPTSLTPRVRALLAALPATDAGFPLDQDWGEAELSQTERVFGWNSFAVLAMASGVPEAPVNAISGSARATCQLRFVVGTDQAEILPALRRHLDQHGFHKVDVIEDVGGSFPATRLDPDNSWLSFTAASLERTCGRPPHLLPNLGGSLPNDCFADILGLPTIWVPHSHAGCSQHAPNEHMLASLSRDALRVMTGLFVDLADYSPEN